jgi:cation:H+ antiporter
VPLDAFLWSCLLAGSLFVLVRGADVFLAAAEAIGLALGLSPFAVGVTLVAMGTSLPELMAAIASVMAGDTGFAMGTAVGSNITNILFVLGVSAIVGRGILVAYELVRVDLPFLFGAALLVTLFALDGVVGRAEGLLMIAGLSVYLTYVVREGKGQSTTVGAAATEIASVEPRTSLWVWGALVIGMLLVQLGAFLTVRTAEELATILEIKSGVIATSIVALGTSLPELIVSVRSAKEGKPELAVGNVIGSNIFNALGVVGGASLFGAVIVPNETLHFTIPAMLAATILCFFVLQEREMTRWDGWLLLILYISFAAHLYHLL